MHSILSVTHCNWSHRRWKEIFYSTLDTHSPTVKSMKMCKIEQFQPIWTFWTEKCFYFNCSKQIRINFNIWFYQIKKTSVHWRLWCMRTDGLTTADISIKFVWSERFDHNVDFFYSVLYKTWPINSLIFYPEQAETKFWIRWNQTTFKKSTYIVTDQVVFFCVVPKCLDIFQLFFAMWRNCGKDLDKNQNKSKICIRAWKPDSCWMNFKFICKHVSIF